MKNPNKTKIKKIVPLKEGESYPFYISGELTLPGGNEYFKLEDPNQIRHLIPKNPYEKYGLEHGKTVKCFVSRINCNGKIYIEPEHPHYSIGKTYEFLFERFEIINDSLKAPTKTAVFRDIFGYDIHSPAKDVPNNIKPGNFLKGRIERIKNGRLIVAFALDVNDFSGMNPGEKFQFQISGTKTYGGKYEYFVLTAADGRKFEIKRKFCREYGLKVGDMVICKLTDDNGVLFLEPEHPFYKTGKVYEFEIEGKGAMILYPEGSETLLLLRNDFGKQIVLPEKETGLNLSIGTTIYCKVTDIKKSQVFLEFIAI
jgi:hypothetical protein